MHAGIHTYCISAPELGFLWGRCKKNANKGTSRLKTIDLSAEDRMLYIANDELPRDY